MLQILLNAHFVFIINHFYLHNVLKSSWHEIGLRFSILDSTLWRYIIFLSVLNTDDVDGANFLKDNEARLSCRRIKFFFEMSSFLFVCVFMNKSNNKKMIFPINIKTNNHI